MLVISHTDCLLKENGFKHPEKKERLLSILDSIKSIKDFNFHYRFRIERF